MFFMLNEYFRYISPSLDDVLVIYYHINTSIHRYTDTESRVKYYIYTSVKQRQNKQMYSISIYRY